MQDIQGSKKSTTETKDAGKVRLGGMAPSLKTKPADSRTADSGKVRMGGMSPTF